MHAYAINAVVKGMSLEHWAHISPASIYNTLSKLEKINCVNVKTEKVGNMPERKVYHITKKGKERLHDELKEAMVSEGKSDQPFYLAVSFAYGIPPKEAIEVIQERIVNLGKTLAHLQEEHNLLKSYNAYNGIITTKAAIKHIIVELESAKEFIDLLKNNPEFYTKDLQGMFHMCRNTDDG